MRCFLVPPIVTILSVAEQLCAKRPSTTETNKLDAIQSHRNVSWRKVARRPPASIRKKLPLIALFMPAVQESCLFVFFLSLILPLIAHVLRSSTARECRLVRREKSAARRFSASSSPSAFRQISARNARPLGQRSVILIVQEVQQTNWSFKEILDGGDLEALFVQAVMAAKRRLTASREIDGRMSSCERTFTSTLSSKLICSQCCCCC